MMKKVLIGLLLTYSIASFGASGEESKPDPATLEHVKELYNSLLDGCSACMYSQEAIKHVASEIAAGRGDEAFKELLAYASKAENPLAYHWEKGLRCDYAVLSQYSNNPKFLGYALSFAVTFNDIDLIRLLLKNKKTDTSGMMHASNEAVGQWCGLVAQDPTNSSYIQMCDNAKIINNRLVRFNKKNRKESA